MVEVQRGNVCLNILEADIPKYMAKGFSVVDAYGNVIKQSVPTELGQLQKAYSEHVELIKAKDIEIAKLKADLEALRKSTGEEKAPVENPSKTKKKPVEEVEETDETGDEWGDWGEESEEKSVKSKKSKK